MITIIAKQSQPVSHSSEPERQQDKQDVTASDYRASDMVPLKSETIIAKQSQSISYPSELQRQQDVTASDYRASDMVPLKSETIITEQSQSLSHTSELQQQQNGQDVVTNDYYVPDTAPLKSETISEAGQLRFFTKDSCANLKNYIAFDVETTGLNNLTDRIIEISAIKFRDYAVSDKFKTLINPGMSIPAMATSINHITNDMVKDAPNESEALAAFCKFIGEDALQGETILIAHNASFDIRFLLRGLIRSDIACNLSFFDTLALSREYFPGLSSYKLTELGKHLNIPLENAHRAEDDAVLCGQIFAVISETAKKKIDDAFDALTDAERSVALWIKEILESKGEHTDLLSFSPRNNYLTVYCNEIVMKFRPNAKKPFAIVSGRIELPESLDIAPCVKSEGEGFVRVFYQDIHDLVPIIPYILERYRKKYEIARDLFERDTSAFSSYCKVRGSHVIV